MLKFADQKSAAAWVATASLREKNVLNSEMIAKLLISEHCTVNSTLGYDTTSQDMAKKFMQSNAEQLRKILFNQEENEYEKLMTYMGIQIGSSD